MSKRLGIRLDQIADSANLAQRYGVSRAVFGNWKTRYTDFPKPLDLPLAINPLYDVDEVDTWHRKRRILTAIHARKENT